MPGADVAAPQLLLAAGQLRLALAPEVGGSIARFERAGDPPTPLLRGAATPASPLDSACFPLVPFCNRIRGGSFVFRGERISLAPNMAGDRSPIHGQGWMNAWTIERSDATSAELVYRHEAGEWPWRYEARETFGLDAKGLSATLACRNLDNRPMPCGLGFHPYFPCTADTRLATRVEHVWTVDADVLPVERIAATGRYDLSGGPVCGRGLDNGYDGWGGEALIETPHGRMRLSSPNARFFQLYSPPGGGLFVAEPVSHANDALGAPEADWPALGIRVLAPGEAAVLHMRIEVGEPSGR